MDDRLDTYDYLYKLVLLGDSGTGKSKLITRFIKNEYTEETKSTIGVEFYTKTMIINDKVVKIQAWDTAGQERFRTITTAYYRGTAGAILCFDITNEQSFHNASTWLNELRIHSDQPNITVLLAGNKSDLIDKRAVPTDTAMRYAQKEGLSFIETSALQNHNVEEAVQLLVKSIYNSRLLKVSGDKEEQPTDQYEQINLHDVQHRLPAPSNSKPCC